MTTWFLLLFASVITAVEVLNFEEISGPDVHTMKVTSTHKGELIYGGSYRRNTFFKEFQLPGSDSFSYFLCKENHWIQHDNSTHSSSSAIKRITVDRQDNIVAAGIYIGSISFAGKLYEGNSTTSMFVVKYDLNGTFLWNYLNRSHWSTVFCIVTGSDNEIYVSGQIVKTLADSKTPNHHTMMLKLKPDGTFDWITELGKNIEVQLSFLDGFVRTMRAASSIDTQGNLVETGSTQGRKGNSDGTSFTGRILFISKRSKAGDVIWTSTASSESDGIFIDVAVSNDNTIYGVGIYHKPFSWIGFNSKVFTFNSSKSYFKYAFIMKFTQAGELVWASELIGDCEYVSLLVEGNVITVAGQFAHSLALSDQTLTADSRTKPFLAAWNVTNDGTALMEPHSKTRNVFNTLLVIVATMVAIIVPLICMCCGTKSTTSNTSSVAQQQVTTQSANIHPQLRLSQVLRFDSQWTELGDILDANNHWRVLGEKLGFTTPELDRIERLQSDNHTKQLLTRWQVKQDATVLNLVQNLIAVGNAEAANLVIRFVGAHSVQ